MCHEDLRELDDQFRPLNLVAHPVRLAADRMLVVASDFDLFVAPETIDELAAAWRPEVWRFPHGHISVLFSRGAMRRATEWVGKIVNQ